MKIERTGATEGTIEEFANRYGLTMEIHINKYSGEHTAHFQGTYVRRDGGKIEVNGCGQTDEEAIIDYAEQINNTTLVLFDESKLEVWRLI